MKIHCRNGCGSSVRLPRSKSWDQGFCPKCFYDLSLPVATGYPYQADEPEFTKKKWNPVDLYWDSLTIKELQIGFTNP